MGATMGKSGGNLLDSLPTQGTLHVVMLGLDSAGKTTALYRLKFDQYLNTVPTIGFNCEKVQGTVGKAKGVQFLVWDVGGQEKLRPLWRSYTRCTDGILFVVDSVDVERMEEAKMELMRTAKCPDNQGVPVLILANKQDLPGARDPKELEKLLGLHELSPLYPSLNLSSMSSSSSSAGVCGGNGGGVGVSGSISGTCSSSSSSGGITRSTTPTSRYNKSFDSSQQITQHHQQQPQPQQQKPQQKQHHYTSSTSSTTLSTVAGTIASTEIAIGSGIISSSSLEQSSDQSASSTNLSINTHHHHQQQQQQQQHLHHHQHQHQHQSFHVTATTSTISLASSSTISLTPTATGSQIHQHQPKQSGDHYQQQQQQQQQQIHKSTTTSSSSSLPPSTSALPFKGWYIQPACAITGEGLQEGLEALYDMIIKKRKMNKANKKRR